MTSLSSLQTQNQRRSSEKNAFFWAQRERIRKRTLGKIQLCYSEQRPNILVPNLGNAECRSSAHGISSEKDIWNIHPRVDEGIGQFENEKQTQKKIQRTLFSP